MPDVVIDQYFKLGRALRTETTFNDTRDFGVGRDLRNFDHLRQIGRHANRRLLAVERLSHNCAISSRTFERIVLPTVETDQRLPGLRFGDPRVMALLAALCLHVHSPDGFSNRTLRALVASLQARPSDEYSRGQMTYDLRRLRLKGLVHRLPGKNRYLVTPAGRRIALFLTKTYARVLRPGFARLDAPPPPDATDPLRIAWERLDREIDRLVDQATLAT